MIVIGDRRAGVINYKLACANGSDVAEPTYDINLEMLLNNRDNASTSTASVLQREVMMLSLVVLAM